MQTVAPALHGQLPAPEGAAAGYKHFREFETPVCAQGKNLVVLVLLVLVVLLVLLVH